MPAIIFFPWFRVSEPVQVERFRLDPYERAGQWPDDVRRILSTYERMSGYPIDSATLVFVDGSVVNELSDDDVEEAFALRRAISFAGLRHRRFFHPIGYVNDHSYACVIQRFEPGTRGMGITSRRRDGGSSLFWLDERRISCPDHVSAETTLQVDAGLATALLAIMRHPDGDALKDAVELFTLANTDSRDVRPHTELLLSVAAAQRILRVEKRHDTREIATRFVDALRGVPTERGPSDCLRKLPRRKSEVTLRQIWFEDFYASRSVVGHGRPGGPPQPIWTVAEHLLLASYIIPRIALLHLAEQGVYSVSDQDRAEVADFDHLLCPANLFGDDHGESFQRASGPWPWTEALAAARNERHFKETSPNFSDLPQS